MGDSFQARLGDSEWEQWGHLARPLFRWAGGKRRFIMGNSDKFPEFSGRYHEPFAGSLAVYFWIASTRFEPLSVRLSDTNVRLIRCYQEIKQSPDTTWETLSGLIQGYIASNDKPAFYYRVREDFNSTNPKGDAPRFLFLMATGWNGVYRTNLQGSFNVPFGSMERAAAFPSYADIKSASVVLEYADLRACSWETSLSAVEKEDFVFLDPPYYSEGSNQAKLYEGSQVFGFKQHEALAKACLDFQTRGINFILTNSFSQTMYSLYLDLGLDVTVVSARRSINSKADDRGVEGELVVRPYPLSEVQKDGTLNMDLDLFLKLKNQSRGITNG